MRPPTARAVQGARACTVDPWRFVEQHVLAAWEAQRSVLDACNDWYSGACLLET